MTKTHIIMSLEDIFRFTGWIVASHYLPTYLSLKVTLG